MDRLTDQDLGHSPDALRATLRTSKIRSKIEDKPLPPMKAPPIRRYLPRYWLTRLYLVASLITGLATVLLNDDSPLHGVVAGTRTGQGLGATVALLCILGLADVVINDLLPYGYSARWLKDRRHLVYNGIALGLLGIGYAVVRVRGWSPALITYSADFAVAVAVAPLDLFARHREG